MSHTNDVPYKLLDVLDPFSTERFTRYIHLTPTNIGFTSTEKAAMLSRYSRSTKSMVDLIDTEFKDKNRGDTFIKKVLAEYGDDSVAEMASEQIGIEGISLLGASKLTDRRIGISFLEKSTRYVHFSPDSFYIPPELYVMGLVEEFKELCALSYKTFNFIYSDLIELVAEKYPLKNCQFHDTVRNRLVSFENLTLESDMAAAEKAYNRAVKDKAFDTAGYCWLLSLKTNIGMNGNCRAIEYLIKNLNTSPLSELVDIGNNLHSLLSQSIEPFITRVKPDVVRDTIDGGKANPFSIYDDNNSIIGVYKHNIVNLLRQYDTFHEDLDHIDREGPEIASSSTYAQPQQSANKPTNYNLNLIKNLLSEIGIPSADGTKIEPKSHEMSRIHIDASSFRPKAEITFFMDEKFCINQLSAAILYENNEILLDYDEQNINNIDQNLRIVGIDPTKLKHGILYDLLNGVKTIDEIANPDIEINKTTENTLTYNDIGAYFEQNNEIKDTSLYQDYNSKKSTINKEQDYIIHQYTKNRKTRRDRLGRATELINYGIELSTSFRIMRDLKRHRMVTLLTPKVITTRNSYDNYIIPDLILTNQHLFEEYRNLIEKSFKLYNKIVERGGDYNVAQYANILGTRVNYLMYTNLRELDSMLSLRTMPAGHEEYRSISQQIYNLLLILHPNLARLMSFVDMNQYPLGRLHYEYKKEHRLRN